MNILWPLISPYFFPIFCAYLFSGVYYITCDVSKAKADRPSYLENPETVIKVCLFWSALLIQNMWRIWHKRSKYHFYEYLKRKTVPQITIFLVLAFDFFNAFRYLN